MDHYYSNLLRSKCRERDGCWIWVGKLNQNCGPSIYLPLRQKMVRMNTMISLAKTAALPKRGYLWASTCKNRGCFNPDHRVLMEAIHERPPKLLTDLWEAPAPKDLYLSPLKQMRAGASYSVFNLT